MIRIALCTLALFGFGAVASAGELDRETGPKPAPQAAKPASHFTGGFGLSGTVPQPAPAPTAGSELDRETPQDAHRYRGGWGYGGWGGGWGYRGFYGYPGFGGWGYRGFYGYPGFGGWGYPGFSRTYISIGFARSYGGFGGWGYPGFYGYPGAFSYGAFYPGFYW